MDIDIFNLVEKQIDNRPLLSEEKNLMTSLHSFCAVDSLENQVAEVIARFGKSKAVSVSEKIEVSLKEASRLLSQKMKIDDISVPVFLTIGCGRTDAFAIPYAGKFAVFFDILTLLNQGRTEAPLSFAVHEIVHGVHFSVQPEYSPQNYKSAEDHLLRYMLSEGVATYISALVMESNEKVALWGDLLDDDKYKDYVKYAEVMRPLYANRIKLYLQNPEFEPRLLSDLFYVLSMEELEKKRIGYLYGVQILQEWKSYEPLLNLKIDFPSATTEFKRYFRLSPPHE